MAADPVAEADPVPPEPAPQPAPADPQALLRLASAALDPRVQALTERLHGPEAAAFVQAALAAACQEPESMLLQQAMQHAGVLAAHGPPDATGAPAAPADGVDVELHAAVWAVVAEAGLAPWAATAWVASLVHENRRAPPPVPGAPAARIGRYELLAPLGSGSSGAVFRARHHDNGRLVALKRLRLEAYDSEAVARFRNEARIAAGLDHPAIVGVFDSGVDDRDGIAVPYLVSELVDGRPFAAALRGLPPARVTATMAQVCEAIAHAHERGVLHRDLKSANVLVDAAFRPHVLDFGIARSDAGGAHATLPGAVLGTPATMSPEQAAGGSIDARSDVWGLGALWFEALTGVPPHDFGDRRGAAALRQVAETEPRRLEQLRPDLPRDLAAVVGKCLEREPARRYRDVAALLADVRRLLVGDPVAARPQSLGDSVRRFARRHRVATVAAAITVLGLVGGGTLALVLLQRAMRSEARYLHEAEAVDGVQRGLADLFGMMVEGAVPLDEQRRVLAHSIEIAASSHRDGDPGSPRPLQVESRLRELLGDLELHHQETDRARAQRLAVLAIQEHLERLHAGDPVARARALVKLGDVEGAQSASRRQLYAAAHAALLDYAQRPDASLEGRDDLGWSYERLAQAARGAGDRALAVRLAGQRVDLARALARERSDGLRHYALASGLLVQALCFVDAAPADPATPAAVRRCRLEAVEHAEAAVAAEPARRAFQHCAAVAHLHVADTALQDGDEPGILAALEAACRSAERWRTADAGEMEAHAVASNVYSRLAAASMRAGALEVAMPSWERAWLAAEQARRLIGDRPEQRWRAADIVECGWFAARQLPPAVGAADVDRWLQRCQETLRDGVESADTLPRELAMLAVWLAVELPEPKRQPERARALLQRAMQSLGADAVDREAVAVALDRLGLAREASALRSEPPTPR